MFHEPPLQDISSAQRFRHENVVARHFDRHVRRKWRCSGLRVIEVRIKRRKRRARTDNTEIDGAATSGSKVILRGIHQLAAQARALPRRSDAQQSEIAAFGAKLDVHASSKAS